MIRYNSKNTLIYCGILNESHYTAKSTVTFDPQISCTVAAKKNSKNDATIELLMLALKRHTFCTNHDIKENFKDRKCRADTNFTGYVQRAQFTIKMVTSFSLKM